jgi:hypothetical protein
LTRFRPYVNVQNTYQVASRGDLHLRQLPMSLTDIEYVLSEVQTAEANAFIERIVALPPGPGVSLDDALQPSLDDEAELHRLFATDKTNARLANPYVGLVDLFDAPIDLRTTRARVPKDAVDLIAKHVMPLLGKRRRTEGASATVCNLADFKRNWSVFTENSLSQLTDWSNVVAAGGSVLACLAPLPEYATASKRAIRKYYHSAAYPASDVDLFLWGMTPEQAEIKINAIYEAVHDSVPWDVTCVRTKHAVSIHCEFLFIIMLTVERIAVDRKTFHQPSIRIARFRSCYVSIRRPPRSSPGSTSTHPAAPTMAIASG